MSQALPELVICDRPEEVTRLRHGCADDLGHRERLQDLLYRVRPTITFVENRSLVRTLEQDLGVPVCIESRGPRSGDKVWKNQASSIALGRRMQAPQP